MINLKIFGTFEYETQEMNRNPRVPEDHQPVNRQNMDQWVNSHANQDRAPLKTLTNNINHVTHEQFLAALRASYRQMPEEIAERGICLVEPNKSQKWIAELLMQNEGFQPIAFVRVGEEGANLLEYSCGELLSDQNTPENPFENVIIADDGSFSGNQMANNISAATRIFKKLAPNCDPQFHIILPFVTVAARNKINALSKKGIIVNLHIATEIPTVGSFLQRSQKPHMAEVLLGDTNKVEYLDERLGMTYFDHNVPNSMSFPERFAEGITPNGENIPFIPNIAPPYKGDPD